MINKQILVGRLGRDPELRHTSAGKPVVNFSVATDNGFGEKKTTEWFDITAWDKTAEACGKYLKKGSLVYVEGRTQTETWEKDGEKKSKKIVVAYEVKFLDSKPDAGGGDAGSRGDELPF